MIAFVVCRSRSWTIHFAGVHHSQLCHFLQTGCTGVLAFAVSGCLHRDLAPWLVSTNSKSFTCGQMHETCPEKTGLGGVDWLKRSSQGKALEPFLHLAPADGTPTMLCSAAEPSTIWGFGFILSWLFLRSLPFWSKICKTSARSRQYFWFSKLLWGFHLETLFSVI